MPKVEHVEIYDDLEYRGGEGEQVRASQTRTFSVGNKAYQTYLSDENAEQFDADFARYTQYAEQLGTTSRSGGVKQSGGGGGGSASRKPRRETHKIREWAKTQDFDPPVSDRGRIPEFITKAYYESHPNEAPAA